MLEHELVAEAISSTKSGHKFQKGIREFINENLGAFGTDAVADMLAGVVGRYRNDIQDWIEENDVEKQERQKTVNNIVNDVSRITRTELGYSIKCTKKKPDYLYEAVKPEPKEPKSVGEPIAELEEDDSIASPVSLSNAIDNLMIHYTLEEIGREVALRLSSK